MREAGRAFKSADPGKSINQDDLGVFCQAEVQFMDRGIPVQALKDE